MKLTFVKITYVSLNYVVKKKPKPLEIFLYLAQTFKTEVNTQTTCKLKIEPWFEICDF